MLEFIFDSVDRQRRRHSPEVSLAACNGAVCVPYFLHYGYSSLDAQSFWILIDLLNTIIFVFLNFILCFWASEP